jgi:metal-dependent amidase/aminoacylase/carboxypeptidase family protein
LLRPALTSQAHPGHGQAGSGGVAPSLAIQTVNVEFFGKTAHAAGAPWDGINALDAANLAYSAISAMRQQLKTTDRWVGTTQKAQALLCHGPYVL